MCYQILKQAQTQWKDKVCLSQLKNRALNFNPIKSSWDPLTILTPLTYIKSFSLNNSMTIDRWNLLINKETPPSKSQIQSKVHWLTQISTSTRSSKKTVTPTQHLSSFQRINPKSISTPIKPQAQLSQMSLISPLKTI